MIYSITTSGLRVKRKFIVSCNKYLNSKLGFLCRLGDFSSIWCFYMYLGFTPLEIEDRITEKRERKKEKGKKNKGRREEEEGNRREEEMKRGKE